MNHCLLRNILVVVIGFLTGVCTLHAAELLVEAEGFDEPGGWVVDQQFIDIMGSPYLLAHGMGKPVSNAKTRVTFPETGMYYVWVRTKDWIEQKKWAPGKFQIFVDARPLPTALGVTGNGKWLWQSAGSVKIANKIVTLELHDLTGFDGRCDVIFFTADKDFVPPEKPDRDMRKWRKKLLNLPDNPPLAGKFDVVVVGGGISGCSAAISAARLGCSVAIIQNRPVFGGNAGPEIGVYGPRWGKPAAFITSEIYGIKGSPRPSTADRQRVMDSESNIKQFVGWHVFNVNTQANKIISVDALNIYSNRELNFEAPVFIDCTGDGWVGFHAGADYRYGQESRDQQNESLAPEKPGKMVLGATLHWKAVPGDNPQAFPDVPWAKVISKDMAAIVGFWTWEYGHNRDMIYEAEQIRDYLFRSIYGSFASAKEKGTVPRVNGRLDNYRLQHVNYILGKRESRRLMGDYIMTQMDCRDTTTKPDKIAVTNNPFDIHIPDQKYDFKIKVDERFGGLQKRNDYDIPYRSLYSRNIKNLLMAGRCISVTHIAHSSTRVMNTASQTGIAAGAAAYLCKKHNTAPRQVGRLHIKELQDIVFSKGKYNDALKPTK